MTKKLALALLTTAAVSSLSTAVVTAGFSVDAAIPSSKQASFNHTYQSSNPTITSIWNNVSNVACADVDTQLSMTSGTCAARMAPDDENDPHAPSG